MANSTGKTAVVLFEGALETYQEQEMMLEKTSFYQPDASEMQNSGNFIHRTVQQHAPIIAGWDMTGNEQDIIQETYPAVLGTPQNDFVQQRADDSRDMRFWQDRGRASGMQQSTELNKQIANAVKNQGSMFYRSNATSGYDFIGEAQALMNERQGYNSGKRCFMLNDRDNLTFGKDLAARQTLQGRPEEVWSKGQIGQNIAEFDVYTGSFLPNLVGGAATNTTVTGNQSFKPEGGSVSATGVVTNVDYRIAEIPVAASAAYNIGDKVTFTNGGTTVKAVGLADKTDTGVAMTFSIVGKPDGTTIQVYPKPIAADDPALSDTEAAYANVDTRILNAATVNRVNTDASKKSNLFWDRDAVEVLGGTIPANLFKQFDGMQVINSTMSNGQQMYMVYDGNIATMNFRYRLFTWYGITIKDPSRCGVAVTF